MPQHRANINSSSQPLDDPAALIESLLSTACCPGCWHEMLEWSADAGAACPKCSARFPILNGVWYAIIPDRSWAPIFQDTISLFMDFNANRDSMSGDVSSDVQGMCDENTNEKLERRQLRFLAQWKRMNIPASARILEVGAGDLRMASRLAALGHHVTVVEPVPEFMINAPAPAARHLAKVCCSAARLPFASETFDVVYCQASLHHVDSIPAVTAEMGRVLRPGGRMIGADEPARAHFSRVDRLHESGPDFAFDLGFNEQVPTFLEYWRAFRRAGIRRIEAESIPEKWHLPHRLQHLGLRFGHSAERAISRGLAMMIRHVPAHGTITLSGIKSRTSRPGQHPPRCAPADYPFDPADYISVRTREKFVEIWTALLDPDSAPRCIRVGENDLNHLRRGFTRRMTDERGEPFKWLMAQGSFLMQVSPGDKMLVAEIAGGGNMPKVEAWQMSRLLPCDSQTEIAGSGWIRMVWTINPVAAKRVCEFQLRALPGQRLDGWPISVKVRSVSLE